MNASSLPKKAKLLPFLPHSSPCHMPHFTSWKFLSLQTYKEYVSTEETGKQLIIYGARVSIVQAAGSGTLNELPLHPAA